MEIADGSFYVQRSKDTLHPLFFPLNYNIFCLQPRSILPRVKLFIDSQTRTNASHIPDNYNGWQSDEQICRARAYIFRSALHSILCTGVLVAGTRQEGCTQLRVAGKPMFVGGEIKLKLVSISLSAFVPVSAPSAPVPRFSASRRNRSGQLSRENYYPRGFVSFQLSLLLISNEYRFLVD